MYIAERLFSSNVLSVDEFIIWNLFLLNPINENELLLLKFLEISIKTVSTKYIQGTFKVLSQMKRERERESLHRHTDRRACLNRLHYRYWSTIYIYCVESACFPIGSKIHALNMCNNTLYNIFYLYFFIHKILEIYLRLILYRSLNFKRFKCPSRGFFKKILCFKHISRLSEDLNT